MSKILILGATSAIAEQFSRLYAQAEHEIVLVARNASLLDEIKQDLRVRGVGKVDSICFDFSDLKGIPELISNSVEILGTIDIALIAFGTLPDQAKLYTDSMAMHAEITLNYNSVVIHLNELANHFEQNKQGCIAVLSSVAGDRGRQSNYIYGSAKGGISIFMQGLRNRLAEHGVQVLTIKPGFVDTPMTKDFAKGALWVGPDRIASDIQRAIFKKRDIIYTPWFWRWVMLIIRFIPERFFKKLKL